MYKIAIQRPVTTFMFALALVFFGVLSLNSMSKSLFPDIDFSVVVVKTMYRGASAETIETKVTDKVEQAVMGIDGVKRVTSSSYRGISVVVVQFELEKPLDEAVNDVRDRISGLVLEPGIDTPTIQKLNTSSTPIVSLFMSSREHSVAEVMNHADNVVVPMLQKIRGVGNVQLSGHRKRQVRIYIDPSLMNKYGLTYAEVSRFISGQNIEIDGGRLVTDKSDFSITTDSNSYGIHEIDNIQLGNGLRLSDIATVEDGLEEEKTYSSLDGVDGIILEIQKIAGANEIEISDGVHAALSEIESASPGYDIRVFRDTTDYVRSSIKDIEFDLMLGAILAVSVVFLFLRNMSITIVSAISIPVSVLATFALVHGAGFTLNMVTMIALTLSIGIIIDDAIVVIENIHRKIEQGLSRREAAYEGVREIGFAIIAISAMLLSVFIPVGAMSGIVGKFFFSFGFTVAIAVVVSYVVMVTVIPMFTSIFADTSHSRFYLWSQPFFDRMDGLYLSLIDKLIYSNKVMLSVLAAVFGLFAMSVYVSSTLGSEFLLKEDNSEFQIDIRAKPGISISEMKRITKKFEDVVKKDSNVEYTTLQVGPGSIKSVFISKIYVSLRPIKERIGKSSSVSEIMERVSHQLHKLPDAKGMDISVSDIPLVGAESDNSSFQLNVYASNEDVVNKSIQNLSNLLLRTPHIKDRIANFHIVTPDTQPEYRLSPIKQNMSRYGITSDSIGRAINAAFSGEVQIAHYKESGKEYSMAIRVQDDKRVSISDIKRIQVRASDGSLIFVDGLVNIEEGSTLSNISRYNRQKSVMLAADPKPGSGLSLGELIDFVDSNASSWLAPGAGYAYGGQADSQADAAKASAVAITLAFVLIYLILAALYESFLQPIIIMVTMPLSFSGGFFANKIAGVPMSMLGSMGLILLIGMVGKNATLLIDVANEKRKEGMSIRDAIRFAGGQRLRPILMTTAAMVAGMLPLVFATGDGSSMKLPIGLIMVGGLIVSMFLSLLVVPIFYTIITPIDERLQRLYKPPERDGVQS